MEPVCSVGQEIEAVSFVSCQCSLPLRIAWVSESSQVVVPPQLQKSHVVAIESVDDAATSLLWQPSRPYLILSVNIYPLVSVEQFYSWIAKYCVLYGSIELISTSSISNEYSSKQYRPSIESSIVIVRCSLLNPSLNTGPYSGIWIHVVTFRGPSLDNNTSILSP